MKKISELLIELNACEEARVWANSLSIEEVVEKCHRGDWLLWLAKKVGVELQPLTLAKARCAKTVIHLMKDQRSINAVNVAEQFGLGNATREQLDASASAAAYASADAAAYAYADASASAAAYAAAYAASADAYAASAAAAASASAAAYAAAYAYAAAKKENQMKTADICKETIGKIIIDLINKKLHQ